MPTFRRRVTVPAAIALALVLTPALTGCSGNPIEQIVEGATGGEVELGGTSVPDSFPAEVPLAEGDVLFGAAVGSGDSQVWNVTVKVDSATAIDDIVAQLEGAGFTNTDGFGGSTPQGGTAALENDAYGVLVVVTQDGENGFVANYTVTVKTAQ